MERIQERETQKKEKRQKEQGGTKATVKWWKVNDFTVHLS